MSLRLINFVFSSLIWGWVFPLGIRTGSPPRPAVVLSVSGAWWGGGGSVLVAALGRLAVAAGTCYQWGDSLAVRSFMVTRDTL